MKMNFLVAFLIIGFVLVAGNSHVSAQLRPGCRKVLVQGHAGQTICENQCTLPGRPGSLKCLRLRTSSRVHICPRSCCRSGQFCHLLQRA